MVEFVWRDIRESNGLRNPDRREQILEAALRLADREGLEGLTVRSLCEEVGVTAPVIYRHFADKEAIVHAIVERILSQGGLTLPTEDDDPREWLRRAFLWFRQEMLAHPQLLPLTTQTDALLEQSLRMSEVVLGVLEQAGVPLLSRGPAFHALMAYTVGSTLMARGTEMSNAAVASVIMQYPNVLANGLNLDPRSEQVFANGLDGILRGFGLLDAE